jgi:hypothetical protein
VTEVEMMPPPLAGYGTNATLKALYKLAHEAPDGDIVELGTFKAQGAIVMSLADRHVVTIDHYLGEAEVGPTANWDHLTGNYARAALAAVRAYEVTDKVELVMGYSNVVLPRYQSGRKRSPTARIGLLVLDANHEELAVWQDFGAWAPFITDGWVAFDDATFPGPAAVLKGVLIPGSPWQLVRTDADGRLVTIRRK